MTANLPVHLLFLLGYYTKQKYLKLQQEMRKLAEEKLELEQVGNN